MKYKTFKNFLMSKHADQYYGVDDDVSDDFDEWLGTELSLDKIMKYADEYATLQKQEIVEEITLKKITDIEKLDNFSFLHSKGYNKAVSDLEAIKQTLTP